MNFSVLWTGRTKFTLSVNPRNELKEITNVAPKRHFGITFEVVTSL